MAAMPADNQGMNWLDITLGLLIAALAVVGLVRGFGKTVFDTLALYAALWLASTLAPLLAAHLSLHAGEPGVNQSWAFGSLFILFGGLLLGVSWYVFGMTQLNAGMFDKLLGMAAGVAAGMILAHTVVTDLVTADPRREASAALVASGTVGHEMYSFPTYHSVLDTITGATTYRRELPNVSGNSR